MFRALQPHLANDPDSVLICDGGEFAQWGQSMLRNDRRMINGVAGSIGSSLPMACGARVVEKAAPIFVVLGDGTFGFHMSEIETAVRLNLPYVAIVGTDARWNAEYNLQVRDYGRIAPWLRTQPHPLRSCGNCIGRSRGTGSNRR